MFGPNVVRNGLTLTRVFSGLNKCLTIANQVIPLYQQAKPMINNARKMAKVFKEFTNNEPTRTTKIIDVAKPISNNNSNVPQFFQ
ncbi:MAG: hypothetical protein E7172_03785 [Firmicutes bacterium]|nr:hypothetical protein [Bacillota bacterium]